MPRPLKTLERVLSKAGLGSRTEARSWIGAGRVRVNGKLVQTPDLWVDLLCDRVTLDGRPVRARNVLERRLDFFWNRLTGACVESRLRPALCTVNKLSAGWDSILFNLHNVFDSNSRPAKKTAPTVVRILTENAR